MPRVVNDRGKVGSHAARVDKRHAPLPSLDAKSMPLGIALQYDIQVLEQQRRTAGAAISDECCL